VCKDIINLISVTYHESLSETYVIPKIAKGFVGETISEFSISAEAGVESSEIIISETTLFFVPLFALVLLFYFVLFVLF
jgi:hypothetical protein